MKTTLTIEESARLIELGVDAKMASKTIVTDDYNEQWENFQHPIFGLIDILSILPKEIDGNVISIISTGFNPKTEELCKGWTATYVTDQFIPTFGDNVVFSVPELIDALYQLLIWCLEQGHCKCGKGGGR